MEFLSQYGLFLLKTITLIAGILIVFAGLISLKRQKNDGITLTSINQHYSDLRRQLLKGMGEKKQKSPTKSAKKKQKSIQNKLFVIDFYGLTLIYFLYFVD